MITDDSPEARTTRELYHSYRKGWRDGATFNVRDVRYMTHATRPDLKAQYERAYLAGHDATYLAFAKEAERIGYDPMTSILRGDPELQPEIDAAALPCMSNDSEVKRG